MTERDMELFRDIQEQALQVKLHIEAEQSGTCRAQEAGLMVWWGKLKEQLAETGCGYLCRCSFTHYRIPFKLQLLTFYQNLPCFDYQY